MTRSSSRSKERKRALKHVFSMNRPEVHEVYRRWLNMTRPAPGRYAYPDEMN